MTLSGNHVRMHRDEVLNLARNQAQDEGKQHPLHRIMCIDEQAATVTIATTDIHLPKRIIRR